MTGSDDKAAAVDPQVLADLERAGEDLGPEDVAGPVPESGPERKEFDQEMAVMVAHGVMMVMEPLAEARGPHWKPNRQAVDNFGEAFAIWFEAKFGKPELSPTWGLVMASLGVFAVPVAGEIQIMKQRKRQAQEGDQGGEGEPAQVAPVVVGGEDGR